MPMLDLRGLRASDRTPQEQKAIQDTMGYKSSQPAPIKIHKQGAMLQVNPNDLTDSALISNNVLQYQNELNDQYANALAGFREQYGTNRNSINGNAEDYINKVGSQFSSYYKKYRGTGKLPLSNAQYKELAAQYQARKNTYGEDSANQWLDNTFKDIVGEHQSWWEQAINAAGSLLPTIEGGAVEAAGNIYGLINPIVSLVDKNLDLPDNNDLNWWDNYWNNVIDNPVTRLGNDITNAQATYLGQGVTNLLGIDDETASQRIENMKNTATKYNPQGIGAMPIVTTEEQDNSLLSSATPWQALQSGGYTALSMIEGAGLAKAGQLIFKGLSGAAKLVKTGRNLEKALEGIKKFQNATEPFVIGGIVGSGEGALEGLQTKMQVESEATNNLDSFYRDKVAKEAKELFESNTQNPMIEVRTDRGKVMQRKYATPEDAYKAVWDKYKDEYAESRRQIDWAASKAGVQNFWANSIINGMINNTFKAGLAAPRIQEALRNNRLTGWAYRNPKFSVSSDNVATPKISKLSTIKQILKEPFGEGLEEYQQSLSNDVFSGAAENNINEFIQNKFNGDGSVKVGDTFASDWGAAATALKNSVTDTNSLQSAILGSVSSVLGTVGGIGRAYHRDKDGNLVRNKYMIGKNLLRGYNADGSKESMFDYISRITPWRSGLVNAMYDRRSEIADANETAATLTEWLKDPTNRAKWDGLTGTANWMTQMEKASESNDQFSYRKAQMGKAINDVFMLSKLKGTNIYDSIIQDLQRASEMDVNSDVAQSMIEKVRNNGGEEFQGKSDDEIIEKIQSNANKMLGLISTVEKESNNLDRMFGRMDEDTKQSLIYGKLMEKNFSERRDKLEEELNNIASNIKTSRGSSNAVVDDDLKKLIMKYGSVNKAVKAQSKLQEQKEKAEKKVEELSNIDKDKRSDKQNKELAQSKNTIKSVDRQLQGFDGLYEKDDKGKSTGKIDASLLSMVLNEQEIMDLDPVTRAMVLAQGADKLYNATHQDRQAVDKINREIDDIDRQIDALTVKRNNWIDEEGNVKKHHNKQVQKADTQLNDLQKERSKKLRELNAAQGDMNSKPVYNDAQQQVIDNLIQQGQQMDEDFLDKVVDMGRLEKGIKDYHTQYLAILADPNVFQNYVLRTKYNAARDLTRRRAERIANIEDFQEYSQELDKLMANASQQEANDIVSVLREKDEQQKAEQRRNLERQRIDNWQSDEDGQLEQNDEGEVTLTPKEEENIVLPESNFDKYRNNIKDQADLVRQFAKNPNLTDNDQSLLIDAMQYLQSKGVSVTNRENAVQTLLEKDEAGNIGGKFRQWVEDKNDNLPAQQRAFMPVFTTIGQVVSDYAKLLDGHSEDSINKGNVNPIVVDNSGGTVDTQPESTPSPSPSPSPSVAPEDNSSSNQGQPKAPSIFDIGGATPESGQFVDDNGTVATDAQTKSVKEKEENNDDTPETDVEKAFKNVTTPEIAKMLNIVDNVIESSGESDEVKELAKQYFMDIAVNGDETYDTLDDLLTAIQEEINKLKQQSMNQEEDNNKFDKAQGILQKAYGLLYARSKRKRTMPDTPKRPENPNASWIHTANIAFMESKNPDAWAVKFTNDHAIDEWHRSHIIDQKEPIYFITDSEWTAEVTRQMTPTSDNPSQRKYDTLTDMPIVAAIKVDEPTNKTTTTAIEVNGQWYQPIGIMPSTKARNSGAALTGAMRRLASKEQGRHLITADGMPNGHPLTSRVFGANYLTAHHPDDKNVKRENTQENNTDVLEDILQTVSNAEYIRLTSMPRDKMLEDEEYKKARNEFLNGLSWDTEKNTLVYTPNRMRPNGTASPMWVYEKPMATTTDRATGQNTLESVLQNGSNDDVVNFNSRTSRFYNEVIRPAFSYYQPKDKSFDKSAKIITQDDLDADPQAYDKEAQRLTDFFNGRLKGSRGVSDFIFMTSGWSFLVTSPEATRTAGSDITNSSTTYKVFLVNNDPEIQPIELGDIRAGQQNTDDAMQLLRNFLYDSNTGTVRDFLKWQKPKSDALNLNNKDKAATTRPRINYGAMVDDGIFELAGSSLVYDIDGVKLRAPISAEGRIIYSNEEISNPTNAQPSAPINNTPQAEGAVETKNGQSVEPNSGAQLDTETVNEINQLVDIVSDKALFPLIGIKPGTMIFTKRINGEDRKVVVTLNKKEKELYEEIRDKKKGDFDITEDMNKLRKKVRERILSELKSNNISSIESPKVSVNSNSEKTEALKKAENITKKIVADSKEFTLSEDESYYYITDKNTGEQTKYLRVTTVIGADVSAPSWTPSIKDIVEKLKENHTIPELSASQLSTFKDIKTMSESLNIPVKDIRRAVAELRTTHKKEKYGAWGIPSTAIGNTADIITRDFLAGHVKDSYPNISKENLTKFVNQLTLFKADLEANGIHVVSEGVMAHGKITMTAEDGTTHDVNVAGTLDLFGYDDEGNFYIFDMKTTRNHSQQKLEDEKAKWSRQISMYADLLRQSYPEINIDKDNLRIIPINVSYPTPMGSRSDYLNPAGPKYSVTSEGQLQMTYRGKEPVDFVTSEKDGTEIALRETSLKGQFQPGYTKFNINWDNLSSEDQDIADAIKEQAPNSNEEETKPKEATIETPKTQRPSFIAGTAFLNDNFDEQEAAPKAPPIMPKGQTASMPSWGHLSKEAKKYLYDNEGIENAKDYNDLISEPADAEAVKQELKCRGLL